VLFRSIQGLASEILGLQHLLFGLLDQLADEADTGVPKAVGGAHGELQFINAAIEVFVERGRLFQGPFIHPFRFLFEVDEQLKKKFRKELKVNQDAVNKYLEDNFPFTRYDSTLADIKIQLLLNSFPFTNAEYKLSSYKLINFADSTAMLTIQGELGWAAAHLKLFDFYFNEKQYEKAIKEIFALMEDRPFYKSALQYTIPKIIKAGYVRDAKHILVRNHKRYPDGFTSKNLGIINLNEGNNKLANDLLNEAVKFNNRDAEAYFHLSRSYFFMNDLESAVSAIEKCLLLNPDYKGAEEIHNRLIKMKKSN